MTSWGPPSKDPSPVASHRHVPADPAQKRLGGLPDVLRPEVRGQVFQDANGREETELFFGGKWSENVQALASLLGGREEGVEKRGRGEIPGREILPAHTAD